MKKNVFLIAGLILVTAFQQQTAAQTVYIPSGTAGIGSSTNANVGVGTSSTPAFKFHVRTNVNNDGLRIEQFGTSGAVLSLNNTGAGGKNYSLFSTGSSNTQGGAGHFMLFDYSASQTRFFVQGGTGYVGIGTYQPLDMLHLPSGKIRVGSSSNYLQIANNGTYQELVSSHHMILSPGTGWVGVNTTTPDEALHVHNGSMKLTGTDPVHGAPNIFWGGTPSVAPNGEWALEYSTSDPAKKGMNFWRPFGATGGVGAGNYFLFLGDNGNVGINTNNATAKLTVNGKTLIGDPAAVNVNTTGDYRLYVQKGILTEGIKVALTTDAINWSDYVFEPDYKLRSLQEVESFVKKNRHLPDVPSASDVYTNGLDLPQMDATLLRKVEELTLYIINLEKRIHEMEQDKK